MSSSHAWPSHLLASPIVLAAFDADQTIPWAETPLVFRHKVRFYVQPYTPSYHTQISLGEMVGSALLLGSPWEYDVPKCALGVPGCSFVNGTWLHTVTGSHVGKNTFTALNNHCHAPTCLSMAVYACSRDTPLEKCDTTNGKLICRTVPIYGGSGSPVASAVARVPASGRAKVYYLPVYTSGQGRGKQDGIRGRRRGKIGGRAPRPQVRGRFAPAAAAGGGG